MLTLVIYGGSKPQNSSPPSHFPPFPVSNQSPPNAPNFIPEEPADDLLASSSPQPFLITGFEVDYENKSIDFEVDWQSDTFNITQSRRVDLFMSTNLVLRNWIRMTSFRMPINTTHHSFTVDQYSLASSNRNAFSNAFEYQAFFTMGLDIDTDGDSLSDAYEHLIYGSSPLLVDTDAMDSRMIGKRIIRQTHFTLIPMVMVCSMEKNVFVITPVQMNGIAMKMDYPTMKKHWDTFNTMGAIGMRVSLFQTSLTPSQGMSIKAPTTSYCHFPSHSQGKLTLIS